jgi:hypothetical protein
MFMVSIITIDMSQHLAEYDFNSYDSAMTFAHAAEKMDFLFSVAVDNVETGARMYSATF